MLHHFARSEHTVHSLFQASVLLNDRDQLSFRSNKLTQVIRLLLEWMQVLNCKVIIMASNVPRRITKVKSNIVWV